MNLRRKANLRQTGPLAVNKVSRRRGFQSFLERLESRDMMAAFTGGNIVVYRVGDGGSALSNAGNPIFLDEFTPSGVLVQSVAMPTVPNGINHPILASGTATSEGFLNLSADGQYLTFTGYEQTIGGSTALSGSSLPRVVGRVDINGTANTSISLTDYAAAANPRSVVSSDGVNFWLAGNTGGIRYVQLNNASPPTTSVLLNDTAPSLALVNFDDIQIYNGQLYASNRRAAGGYNGAVLSVGTGLPTVGGQTISTLPGIPIGSNNFSFFFATLDTAAHGSQPDTLYLVNDTAGTPGGQIQKYSATTFDSLTGVPTAWVATGTAAAAAARGLTGYVNGSTVVMYASTGGATTSGSGSIYAFTDTSGYNGIMSGTATTIVASTPNNEAFRGIAFVPNAAPVLSGASSTLPGIVEDVASASNPGQLVSQVISGLGANAVTDTAGARQGIAITAADSTNGTWQYSSNGGASWQSIGAVSSDAALLLAADGATRVRFAPNLNYNGSATFGFRSWDQSQGSAGGTFKIAATGGASPFSSSTATASVAISAVNDPPIFVRGPSQSVLTTAGAQTVSNWATGISPGAANESGQTLNFIVSNNANGLFAVQPAISPAGVLSFTPSGVSGTATVTVQLHDNGGGADTSPAQTFQITLNAPGTDQPPVNSIPFAVQTTLEETPLTFSTASGNAISISDPDAVGNVQVTLAVTGGTATLSSLANLTGSGNGTANLSFTGTIANLNLALAGLIFTPAANINGPTAGQIVLTTNDLASPGSGGPLSASDTISISITPVNDAPSFVRGPDETVDEGTGAHSVNLWASGVLAGPADESSQTLSFVVTNDNHSLFAVQPSISPAGTLTYTLATPSASATGQAIVSVQLSDNGGTANGGSDTSAVQTFLINVTQVNQPPVNTVPGVQREIKDTPLVFSSAGFNRISVSDIDGFASTEQVTLTATSGTLTLAPLSGVSVTTGTGAGDATVTFTGTLTQLNAALNGLTFTPTAGYVGAATVQISTNDLNSSGGGSPITTGPTTVNINVVAPPPLVISELLFNPPDIDAPNEYLEIRSATPNYTIPAGTFLVTVSGAPVSIQVGNSITTYPAGTIFDTFDLSNKTTGSNGYLVILQNANTYGPDGLNLIHPQAAVLSNTGIGAGAGFGNNLAAPGSSLVGHSALFRARGDTDILKPSATYLLINTSSPVNPGDNVDQPAAPGGAPTGALHGPQFAGWTVYDSVGGSGPTSSVPGEVSYGYLNFLDSTGVTNFASANTTVVPGSFTGAYFGRTGNTFGSVAADWTAAGSINGLVPTFGFGGSGSTSPGTFARRPLNNIGSANFDSSLPAVVTTTAAPLNYVAGSGAIAIDTAASVTDPDSSFLGSAVVSITDNFDPTKDTLTFTNTLSITGLYDANLGVLTLQGFDTFENWNAALQSVTYTNSSSASGQAARTVSFAANDRLVLSNVATRVINIQASGAPAPIVGGAAAATLAYTENGVATPVAPTLTVTDAGATSLLSATVSVALGFASGQDVLGFDTLLATSFGIEGNYVAASGKLFLTGASSVANYQSLLRTVTYFNSSDGPAVVARKITFAVTDTNNTSSSISPVAASRTISVTAVNDAPLFTPTAGPNSYTVGSPAVVVDANLGLVDPDSASLTGATVSITGGFAAGDVLGYANQLGITGSYNAATGVLTLTGPSSVANYRSALQTITFFNPSAATSTATRTVSFTATDGALASLVATRQVQLQTAATVVGKNLFYNNSTFDGNNAATGAADDAAIASDKQALLPGGAATFANYSSYKRGINGLMIDIAGLPGSLDLTDFTFKVGNNSTPGGWATGPAPSSLSVRAAAGIGGASRVSLTWADGAIKNQWLQVTVNATAHTGLATPVVFYFGNAIGETGDAGDTAVVNATDELGARMNPETFLSPATIGNVYDFNRDGFVNATDQILARSNSTTLATSLKLISPPASLSAAASPGSSLPVTSDIAAGLNVAAKSVTETVFGSTPRVQALALPGPASSVFAGSVGSLTDLALLAWDELLETANEYSSYGDARVAAVDPHAEPFELDPIADLLGETIGG